MKIAEKEISGLIKRVRQIAQEVDIDYKGEYSVMRLDTLAFRLKILASEYNCYINSWITVDSSDRSGIAECYRANNYVEEEEDTWELIAHESEPIAVVGAFKWLADRGYFKPETKITPNKELV